MASTKFVNHKYHDKSSLKRIITYVTSQTTPELISTNCATQDSSVAYKRMMETKQRWNKEAGNQLFHVVLSLSPEESKSVSPDLMLRFG